MSDLLRTDGYKLSMAEAGYPLRRETFYYTHRRGGPGIWPLDTERAVRALLPLAIEEGTWTELARLGYPMGDGFRAAVTRGAALEITSIPKGAWYLPGEPIFSITGPSALVSWLEPQVLMWAFRAQVATAARVDPAALAVAVREPSCPDEAEIVRSLCDDAGLALPAMTPVPDAYRDGARARAAALVSALGTGERVFEVGLRAATCLAQHRLVLEGCRSAGVTRTSHVALAKELGMIAVGTMGHEHVQRFGSDEAAFRAMKERRPQRSSFLLDTFDTLRSGIPTALRVMADDPSAGDSVRYDSGDKEAQLRAVHAAAGARGLRPVHVLEDGFDLALTEQFERVRAELGIPADRMYYGYGGHLVGRAALGRDRVAAVYKLSQSGTTAVMKFSDDAGKRSVPGRPVVFRRVRGAGPRGIVGQVGEPVPAGYALLSGAASDPGDVPASPGDAMVALSEATQALVARCESRRERVIEEAKEVS